MGLFDLITNTVEGVVQTAVNAVKLPVTAIISPLDDGKAVSNATNGIKEGIDKIGKGHIK